MNASGAKRFALLVVAALSACEREAEAPRTSAVEDMQRAIDLLGSGQQAAGLALAETTLDERGKDPALAARSDLIALLWHYLLEADPSLLSADLLVDTAFLHGNAGDPQRMQADLLTLASAEPPSFAPRYALGILAAHSGQADTAESWFRSAMMADPERPEAHFQLGGLLADAGRLAEAKQEFDAALRLQPDDDRTRFYRGVVLESLGTLDEALADLRAVAAGTGEFAVRAQNKVGTIVLRQGDTAGAIEIFQQTLARKPDHAPALLNLGSASLAAGRYDVARDALEKLAALDPTDARPDLLLGQLEESLGDVAAAERRYRAALALAPGSPDVRSRLALLLYRTGRDAEAAALEASE